MRKRRGTRRKIATAVGWFALAGLGATVLIVGSLRWVAPPTSSYMLRARHDSRVSGAPGLRIRYQWADWREISPQVAIAVVAAEDQKFPVHRGFDVGSIKEAMRQNPHRRAPRGASTISQQVAKNLFLWPGRNLVRKGLEAYFTVLIELTVAQAEDSRDLPEHSPIRTRHFWSSKCKRRSTSTNLHPSWIFLKRPCLPQFCRIRRRFRSREPFRLRERACREDPTRGDKARGGLNT